MWTESLDTLARNSQLIRIININRFKKLVLSFVNVRGNWSTWSDRIYICCDFFFQENLRHSEPLHSIWISDSDIFSQFIFHPNSLKCNWCCEIVSHRPKGWFFLRLRKSLPSEARPGLSWDSKFFRGWVVERRSPPKPEETFNFHQKSSRRSLIIICSWFNEYNLRCLFLLLHSTASPNKGPLISNSLIHVLRSLLVLVLDTDKMY